MTEASRGSRHSNPDLEKVETCPAETRPQPGGPGGPDRPGGWPWWLQVALWVLWAAYVFVACWQNLERAWVLLLLSSLAFAWWLQALLRDTLGWSASRALAPLLRCARERPRAVQALQAAACLAALACWVWVDVRGDPYRLVPFGGLFVFIAGAYALSRHRAAVRWRPVVAGILIQLVLGVVILRTRPGLLVFRWLGAQVSAFLDHVETGCEFVFGDEYQTFFFAFKVLPIVVYFGSVVAVLYYLGWIQYVFVHVAQVVQALMGTSAPESFVAAANIFIGQTEAPLLIKPFLSELTLSEMHAVMTCGFATIAGGVMAAYISFGVPAQHLIAASVMSCPAALAMSKLSYPETEQLRIKLESVEDVSRATSGTGDHNIIDAASNGATSAVSLAVCIAANLIAFLSIWGFVDSALSTAGEMVDIEGLSVELLCSYLFWPVAFVMGVPPGDCRRVARLLGEKTFINEFVAYRSMTEMVAEGGLSRRAEVVATYALCGFSNIGSIGVQLGGMGPLAPGRRKDMADVVVRAMLTGTVACFMTACVAGMLYQDD